MDFESTPFAVLSLQSPIIGKMQCRLTLQFCLYSGRGANKLTYMSTHKRKEGIAFSVEDGITMGRTESIMPGKADSMLKVIQNGLATLEIGSEIKGMVFNMINLKQNEALQQK